jgi:hypothetical protein
MSITTILQGGMANQMFQYAFGLAQARRLKTLLVLDATRLGGKRPFNLGQWSLPSLILTTRQEPTVIEHGMNYNPYLYDLVKDGEVLQGYWQNEKYLITVEEELREIFVPFAPLSERAKQLQAQITGHAQSTFIHVRRGDYLKEPHKSFHGVLGYNYYGPAMQQLCRNIGNEEPKLFIFSDDIEWCKQRLSAHWEYVEPGREAEDIYLMSLCRNAIIANSSFSWWGAWLGDHQRNRTVVAPQKWFTDEANEDYSGVVPQRWVKI